MSALLDNADLLWQGFSTTLYLSVVAGITSLAWGTILAIFRVSPVGPLRSFSAAYVEIFRNTPLTLLFLFFLVAASQLLGVVVPIGRPMALIAMTLYTASFVAEVIRSGVNSVAIGQAEAARSVGMSFMQTLRLIILPQALRSVYPPLVSVYVAHIKNTSVAAGFATTELTAVFYRLANANPGDQLILFAGIATCYLVLTIPLGLFSQVLEKKGAIAR